MKGLLAQAIGELPDLERQLLALRYYEELTMKEVGAVLGIGEARVSQLHTAAVSRLRARMNELLEARGPTRAHAEQTPALAGEEQWKNPYRASSAGKPARIRVWSCSHPHWEFSGG
jgi:hypothetical protein